MEALTTYFAPAQRATREAVLASAAAVRADLTVTAMLEAMPTWTVLVNRERQIVAANRRLLDAFGMVDSGPVLGQRAGEVLGCQVACTAPSGCGTAHACAFCGAAAMERAWETGQPAVQECLVLLPRSRGSAMDLEVVVSPSLIDHLSVLVVAIRDVGAEKRRRVLERVFFHDVMNTAAGIQGIARVLNGSNAPELDREFKHLLLRSAAELLEEIADQRQLTAAEAGEIVPSPSTIHVPDLLSNVRDVYAAHDRAEGRTLRVAPTPDMFVESDLSLLRRVLGNMVKNALEASAPGEVVTMWAEDLGTEAQLAVHNSAVMAPQVAAQIFHRSFSTKGVGRGIGTHSIRLLGEHYLHGTVAFTSTERGGTTFTLRIPTTWPDLPIDA